MIFVVCRYEAIRFPSEALADTMVRVLNRAGACGGSDHMVIEADTARAAHDSYLAAFAPRPRAPYKDD